MTVLLRRNPWSGAPVSLQLMEQVKDALAAGAFRRGEPVAGLHPLAEELVINPNTVARAYRGLEHEGVITLRHPGGAEVAFTHGRAERSPASVHPRTSRELALENSRLTAQIAAEVANRVERTRELERAGEVHERLFPQAAPPVPGV